MKSIKENKCSEYIINKSRFICELIYINNESEINDYLKEIKNKYECATHYCYGYIINNIEKCSDDNEPQGTAGMPILNVLKNNDLNHILCVVIRYFGGIKLGTGGLVRAYTKSATNCIDLNNICDLIEGLEIDLKFTYENIKQIDNILKNINIINKEYNQLITYKIQIDKNNSDILNKLNNLCENVIIVNNILIKK